MKKLLCLLLAVLLMFGLAACKEQPQNSENTGTSEESGSTADTGSTDTSDTTENSQNQQEEIPATKIVYLCTEETISYTTEKGGSKTTRTYDEKGNKLTYKAYDNSGKVVGTEEYTYNEAGQLISQKSRNDDSYPVDSAYTYNEDGLLAKKSGYLSGKSRIGVLVRLLL